MKKRFFLAALPLLFLLCGCSSEVAENTTEASEPFIGTEIGISEYSCITGESEMQEAVTENGTVMVKAFSHKIYDPMEEYMVTLTTVLTFPAGESGTEFSSVSGSLSDAQAEGFTISEHVSGDTATIVLYRNQLSVCHLQYRIHKDGTIEFL